MTANQIAYNRQREEVRHNLVSELHSGQQAQAALSQADTAGKRQTEDARHNRETERVNWWTAQETQRHNVSQEQIGWGNLDESRRHNLAQERTNQFAAESTARYQSAQSEAVLRQAAVSERQAAVAERNAAVNEGNLAESIRHNGVLEAESQRHNQYQESIWTRQADETVRSNKAKEALSQAQIGLGYSQLAESVRHNKAYESEVNRSNLANEQLRSQQLYEEERAHKASEYGAARARVETARSNKASEELKREQNRIASARNQTYQQQVNDQYLYNLRMAAVAEKRAEAAAWSTAGDLANSIAGWYVAGQGGY